MRTPVLQHTVLTAVSAAMLLVLPALASAQGARDYGSRPIRLVVPVPAGGGTDIVARIVAAGLAEGAGLRLVVDNRPGAGGAIGSEMVARAVPDGYTLLFAYASHTTTPFMSKVSYDAYRDFSPVSLVSVNPLLLEVNASLPVANVKELIAFAKSSPKGLNAGVASSGSAGHLAAEIFKLRTGTTNSIASVIYKGGEAAQVALLSGEVQIVFASVLSSMPYAKSGKVRILATLAPNRLADLPDVPTLAEIGVSVDVAPWYGVLGPARMPRAIVMRLYNDIAKAVKSPTIVDRLAATGANPVASTPDEFSARIRRELDEFGKIIPALGLNTGQ
jgi:tripartite-type tricarboxylate transporter receptor subunit TctC